MGKAWLDKCLKRLVSEHPSTVNNAKVSETLLESLQQHFDYICSILGKKLNLKKSLLVLFEILRLFVNTLTPDDKFFLRKVKICRNQFKCNYLKTFSKFFASFLKFIFNFKYFEKKDDPHS